MGEPVMLSSGTRRFCRTDTRKGLLMVLPERPGRAPTSATKRYSEDCCRKKRTWKPSTGTQNASRQMRATSGQEIALGRTVSGVQSAVPRRALEKLSEYCPRSRILLGQVAMNLSDAARDRLLKEALRYRLELVAYARSLLGNYAAAEDAVQEAMLVVVKKFDQFEEGTSILAWCRAIVRLEVLRAKQQCLRDRTLAERLLDDAVDAAFEEFQLARRSDAEESWREALERCLERVSESGRRVLYARLVDELGYQQISDRVGMTIEAVRKTLFRLKKQVRTCMETRLRGAQ